METRHVSDHPHFRMMDAIGGLGGAEVSPRDFAGVVTRLLDEFDAADFRGAERILEVMRRQGRTVSGFPRIRPADCNRVIVAIRLVFEANRPAILTGDSAIVERFEQILDAFSRTDVRHYPRELMQVRALQAEARLLMQDPDGVRALIGQYADRIYKIQGDLVDVLELMKLDCEARAAQGDVPGLGRLALLRAIAVARLWPYAVAYIASDLMEFIAFDRSARARDGVLAWVLTRTARTTLRFRTPGGSISRRIARFALLSFAVSIAAGCLFFLRRGDIRFGRRAATDQGGSKDIVVTRAMGGLGDLLMMTPGLRALARRHSTRVKLVVERKFFDVFRNNPHVELIDIDGPPVDVAQCKSWCNLTLCPAAVHESSRRPFVTKGRVELFAGGMGVDKRTLDRYGWNVEYALDAGQIAFRDEFIRTAGLGARPIIGVQPYSRELIQRPSGYFFLHRSAQSPLRHHCLSSSRVRVCPWPRHGLDCGPVDCAVDRPGFECWRDGVRGFRIPASGCRLRRTGRRDVRPDRRKIVYSSSSSRDRRLGQRQLRLRALLAQRGHALLADRQVRLKSLRGVAEG